MASTRRFTFGGEDTAAGWAAIEDGGRWVFDETCAVTHDIVERPLRWHLMMAWREGNLVDVAARHPAFRAQGLWRRWAHRPWNVAVPVRPGRPSRSAWCGGRRCSPSAPWLWCAAARRGAPGPVGPWASPRCWLVNDLVVLGGMLRGSLRNRTLVL